jgi:hypothetical protein
MRWETRARLAILPDWRAVKWHLSAAISAFGGDIGVNVEERCPDEELICIPR